MSEEAVQSGGAAAQTEQATQADIASVPAATDGRNEALSAIVKSLEKGEASEPDASEPKTPKPEPEGDKEGEKKPEPEKKDEPAKFDPAEHRKKVDAALDGLTEEQKAAVLASTSAEFAALHSREKRLKKREREFLELKGKTDGEIRELQATKQEFDQELTRGKENPLAALELFGWTLEDAHAYALNDNTIPHEKRMKLLEERADSALTEKLAKLDAREKELAEQAQRIQEHTWHEGVKGEIDQFASDNVRWYIEKFSDGHSPAERKDRVAQAVRNMQKQVHEYFKGTKTLDVRTALGRMEQEVADTRRSWGSDPQREGGVQSPNLEAGSKPEPKIPSAASSGQRHHPPNGGGEPMSREEVLRAIVSDLERRA